MVKMAQHNGLLCGLAENLIPKGVAILQYADDTIICLKNDVEKARNMKLLLYLHEVMSGLKINFGKSEVILVNGDNDTQILYADLFNCQAGLFPIKYLGVPVGPGRLHIKDWVPLQEKNLKKLSTWKGSSLSMAGRLTLINSSLSSTFIYHMSMYLLPKTTTEILDKQRRTFFQQGNGSKKKYHLIQWKVICKSKHKGGLGIKDIRKMNISLLSKWWWKLETEDGLWQSIVKAKYMQGNNLITTIKHKADDSPIWSDLLKIRQFYLKGRSVTTKNGQSTLFWDDPWLHQKPLCILHPVLYDICQDKNISVHTFILKQAQLSFSRWLPPILFDSWVSLIDEIYAYPFANSSDEISWKGGKNGKFSTKSVYDMLTSGETGLSFKSIWKAKIPHRIKLFLWLLENQVVLTKDNLLKRNWQGDPSCYFCTSNENIDHLFFLCPVAKVIWGTVALCLGANNIPENIFQYKIWITHWLPLGHPVYTFCLGAVCWAIWKKRNEVCFENKSLKHPTDIILYACALMTYWAGLYGSDMQGKILDGVKILISCVHKVMAQLRSSSPRLLLDGPSQPQASVDDASDEDN